MINVGHDVGAVIGGINQRRGTIVDTEVRDDEFTVTAEVALNDMFGYSTQLRGMTQGKGMFRHGVISNSLIDYLTSQASSRWSIWCVTVAVLYTFVRAHSFSFPETCSMHAKCPDGHAKGLPEGVGEKIETPADTCTPIAIYYF